MRMFLSQLQKDDPRTAPQVAAQQLNTKTVKHADDTKNAQGLANLLLATAKPSGLSCSSKGTHQDAESTRNHGTVKKQTPNHIVHPYTEQLKHAIANSRTLRQLMRLRVMELPAAEWSAPLLLRGLLANCSEKRRELSGKQRDSAAEVKVVKLHTVALTSSSSTSHALTVPSVYPTNATRPLELTHTAGGQG